MSAAPIVSLAWRSILSRGLTAALTVAIVAVSVMLYLGVEKARQGARASFENTISGVDLIVGGALQPGQSPALFGVPYRRRHEQHHLG